MTHTNEALQALTTERLLGIRRGIEKESLRTTPQGDLARTPHPRALGSALTHPHITTDFSESQVELITGVHATAQSCLHELLQLHQFTAAVLEQDMLWASSMPCCLPADDHAIPIGQYGHSNVGRAKSVYRLGLGHRYGRRMQTISGIHYNWSLPAMTDDAYFGLIRNFRRHAFLLLYLFGASPAVCSSFVQGREHALQHLGPTTAYLPFATSLRMGRLGYQSDAQASLAVSYNNLQGYGDSLQNALTQPYPAYEAIGTRDRNGQYQQLATTLLQIENEFYGTIRPKRTIRPGERPLHALRERGVEYIEVRLMDLDPFEPVGISLQTLRFLDVFLLHCMTAPSPADSPEEIAAMARNQHLVAQRGREPGLRLERAADQPSLVQWGLEILQHMEPIARQMDSAYASTQHSLAVAQARARLQAPQDLPSARVLERIEHAHAGSFTEFARTQSLALRDAILAQPLDPDTRSQLQAQALQSWQAQAQIEASDTLSFDAYLADYLSLQRLQL